MIFNYVYKPIIEDYDNQGNYKTSTILKAFGNSGSAHSDASGDNVIQGSNSGKAWVLLDWKIEVLEAPKMNEELRVETWIEPLKSPFGTIRSFLGYVGDKLCAKGITKWVLLDVTTGRPSKIEADLIERYTVNEGSAFEGSKIEKIAEPENYTSETEILVRRADIDWNNHVHNLTYLDYALDCLPEDVYTNKNFKKVRITFKHEISGRKIIKGKYGETENASVVAIHNEKGDLCTLVEFKE